MTKTERELSAKDGKSSAQTRNTERTRRAVLDAAAKLLLQRGGNVSVADVATAAGVSKSGLLHHFASRDVLFLEVLRDLQERQRAEVQANLDLSENTPGKVLRAYVRALCLGSRELSDFLSAMPFWVGLEGVPGALELDHEDQAWWREQFIADGIDPTLARIVRRAAEGLASGRACGDESDEDVRTAGEELIRFTFSEEAFARPDLSA